MKNNINILNENPDGNGKWRLPDAISFGLVDNVMYIGYNPFIIDKYNKNNPILQKAYNELGTDVKTMMHIWIGDFYSILYGDEGISDLCSMNRDDFEYSGRIWIERKIISFWAYPSKEKLPSILNKLKDEINKIYGIVININEFSIELDLSFNDGITYDNEKELFTIARNNPDFKYADVTYVKVKDYENGIQRSPEELRMRHTDIYADRSDMKKNIKNIKLPQGMSKAEYNSKIKTSESKNTKKTVILDEKKLSLLKSIVESSSNPYNKKVNVNKVRQGIMMYEDEIGFEAGGDGYGHLIDETLTEILGESNNETLTLYHGLRDYSLEHVLAEKELTPRVCSEGGPKAIYFSTKPLEYPCLISINVPVNEIGNYKKFLPYAHEQYICLKPIHINEYNFKINKISGININDKDLINYWKKLWKENNFKIIDALHEHFCDMAWHDVILPLIDDDLNNLNLEENIDDEIKSSEISLSSFKPQYELNSKIWINDKLNSRVRLKLLDIADDFIDKLEIDWIKPVDIVITGSLTNYNWSKYSDIDLHIIYEFKKIDEKFKLVKDYFDSKRKMWNNEHDNLKIYGFPIEIYVQDIGEEHTASGLYSLEKNKWLIKPIKNNIEPIKLDKFFIKEKSANLMTLIDEINSKYNDYLDDYEAEKLGKKAKMLFNKIKNMRKTSLANDGEMSSGNIIFKILRRTGYINKLIELKSKTYDLVNSIK